MGVPPALAPAQDIVVNRTFGAAGVLAFGSAFGSGFGSVVPEPGSLALALRALVAVGGIGARRNAG